MKEIELLEKRKPREKHFLRDDGTIIAKIYSDDIHYKKNRKYEEIDNTLVKENGYYSNKNNDYKVYFPEHGKDSLMKMEKDDNYLDIKLKESNNVMASKKKKFSKFVEDISYNNILDDINIKYRTLPNKIKETIVLQNNEYTKFTFVVNTNLDLVEYESSILAQKDSKTIFNIESPYMVDSNGNISYNISYYLRKVDDNYEIDLILDEEWLNSIDTKYPVYIDPTITNISQASNFADTYIYPGDFGVNKGSQDILKAGVERINGQDRINRTLIKFDLPKIGTGSEVIDASINLVPYLSSTNNSNANENLVEIHRVTENWTENDADWNRMNNKYEKRVEAVFTSTRSYKDGIQLNAMLSGGDLTNLVKKWYRDTPNYGIMLKSVNELYIDNDYPAFYSKNNDVIGDPKPYFTITYKNQNGLENYLDYKNQSFTDGDTYVNTYNGNMTGIFKLGSTIGGQLPASLQLIYNTNDVVLKHETAFGIGYKLNLEQTIKQVTIDNIEYLEYIDEDGTIHYFYKKNLISGEDSKYYDEDGLELEIEKQDNQCIMTDKNKNIKHFSLKNSIYYLDKIVDSDSNAIEIERDSDNKIVKVIDSNNSSITITYNK